MAQLLQNIAVQGKKESTINVQLKEEGCHSRIGHSLQLLKVEFLRVLGTIAQNSLLEFQRILSTIVANEIFARNSVHQSKLITVQHRERRGGGRGEGGFAYSWQQCLLLLESSS